METLRRIDEDIRALHAEAEKSKFGDVVGACDKAVEALKGMREHYVSSVMRSVSQPSISSTIINFRSTLLSQPYVLACNHAGANIKMVIYLKRNNSCTNLFV